ncbi:TetR/AcrR family transcriptional regulator [Gracilibacillus salinarum]|uniref:TetR/AcrR family transcriptional regulator C-terminal domain-containing protein n=1 Tax=Gracilibacillus salinarum TaxID=2932255 RepID=A0ABY4GMB5_9BACI|nr:TetR/AcrR family transcriptional regulator C-terminal domain-containing protein [Gracilibacillus salinarum]UOQ84502.1 TetR/AcrR family transcriptional regulator C-terminal domain-containing protein [Gracilibacillus salinarum]
MDRRITKTLDRIMNALFTLSSQKAIKSITVSDIITEADINRATFYYHYKDKYDLIDHIANNLLKGLQNEISLPIIGTSFSDIIHPPLLAAFAHVDENRHIYHIFLSEKGLVDFPWKMTNALKESIGENVTLLQKNGGQIIVSKDFLTNYIAGAILSLIMDWIKNDLPFSPQEMADQMTHVLTQGIYKQK